VNDAERLSHDPAFRLIGSEQLWERGGCVALSSSRMGKTCPFPTVPVLHDDFHEVPDTPPQWVKPSMVVEVEYRQRLKDGLRHAALKGLRPDKKPGLIRRSPMSERGPF
jgi:hypothetical protein